MHKPCKVQMSREDVTAAIEFHLNVNVFQFEAGKKVTKIEFGSKYVTVTLEPKPADSPTEAEP